jgi:hypothetical protein
MRRLTPSSEAASGSRHAAGEAAGDDAGGAVSVNAGLDLRNAIADVRDGLTREERVVLWVLHETQKERGGRSVPTTMLWGRVCEHFYISPEDLSAMLARLGARRD